MDKESSTKAFENFEDQLTKLEDNNDVRGILDYLISLKNEISHLPTSHKNTPITIQRIILLILPLLKLQDDRHSKSKNNSEYLYLEK